MLIATMAVRADPRRAAGVLSTGLINALLLVLPPYWYKVMVDGALAGDVRAVLFAAVGLGAGAGVMALGNRVLVTVSTVLQEKTGFLIDQRLMELSAAVPGIEHHERSDYQDKMELLRSQRGMLGGSVSALLGVLQMLVSALASVSLLATVHPVLVVLGLFSLPAQFCTARATAIRQRAMDETAEATRRTRHLYQLTTSARSAKEIRMFGLGDELAGRHRRLWEERDRTLWRSGARAMLVDIAGWGGYAVGYMGARVFVVLQAVSRPDQVSLGDVVMVFNLSRQVNTIVASIAATVSWCWDSLAAVGRLLWLAGCCGWPTTPRRPADHRLGRRRFPMI